jgi:hypothetical protein
MGWFCLGPDFRFGLSDIEERFICTARGMRGADVRPDFDWNRQPTAMMDYRWAMQQEP